MSVRKIASLVLQSLFTRPATRRYPRVRREPFANARGHIEIDINLCIFCGLCSRKCPSAALTVRKEEKLWAIERLRCIICGYCVEVCPKKCLFMKNTPPTPTAEKVTETFKQQ